MFLFWITPPAVLVRLEPLHNQATQAAQIVHLVVMLSL
jgi:hypothetical protein